MLQLRAVRNRCLLGGFMGGEEQKGVWEGRGLT